MRYDPKFVVSGGLQRPALSYQLGKITFSLRRGPPNVLFRYVNEIKAPAKNEIYLATCRAMHTHQEGSRDPPRVCLRGPRSTEPRRVGEDPCTSSQHQSDDFVCMTTLFEGTTALLRSFLPVHAAVGTVTRFRIWQFRVCRSDG
jgi:hypothetical protein